MKTGFLEVAQEAVKTLRALNDATATAFLANAMEQVAAAAYMGDSGILGVQSPRLRTATAFRTPRRNCTLGSKTAKDSSEQANGRRFHSPFKA